MLGWSSLPPDTRIDMRLLKYVKLVITPDTRLAMRLLKYVRMVITTS